METEDERQKKKRKQNKTNKQEYINTCFIRHSTHNTFVTEQEQEAMLGNFTSQEDMVFFVELHMVSLMRKL